MYLLRLYIAAVVFLISESTLLSLIVMHRHGDRTPTTTYPNDPYACMWTQGLGVLTEEGKQRMKNVGEILRKRYSSFWPNKSELEVRSSRSDRCIKSVESIIDGVYRDDFLEAPIPIRSPLKKHDDMLSYASLCPAYTAELNEVMQAPNHLRWAQSSKKFFNFLTKKTGREVNYENVVTRGYIRDLYDLLTIQKQYNLTLPDWANDQVLEKLLNVNIYTLKLLYGTHNMQRLKNGQFLRAVRDQMNAIKNKEEYRRIQIYSTHDIILSGNLLSMKIYNDQLPPFGATLVLELHSLQFKGYQENYFIKPFYLNETYTEVFHPLKIPGCSLKYGCTFQQFIRLTESLIPVNWYEECNQSNDYNSSFGKNQKIAG